MDTIARLWCNLTATLINVQLPSPEVLPSIVTTPVSFSMQGTRFPLEKLQGEIRQNSFLCVRRCTQEHGDNHTG